MYPNTNRQSPGKPAWVAAQPCCGADRLSILREFSAVDQQASARDTRDLYSAHDAAS